MDWKITQEKQVQLDIIAIEIIIRSHDRKTIARKDSTISKNLLRKCLYIYKTPSLSDMISQP